jgi:hypothetical protein
LDNLGKISAEVAKSFAEKEFEKFNAKQVANYQNDFDRMVDATKKKGGK